MGQLSIFVGQISMTEGHTEDYGMTYGTYTITYTDEAGEEHTQDISFSLEIVQPVIEKEEEPEITEEPAFQWWITILVGLAIIAIIVSVIVVTKFIRESKLR